MIIFKLCSRDVSLELRFEEYKRMQSNSSEFKEVQRKFFKNVKNCLYYQIIFKFKKNFSSNFEEYKYTLCLLFKGM